MFHIMRHSLFSFVSLFGETKSIILSRDLTSCGVCISTSREKDFILEPNQVSCLCSPSGLFIGDNLTIEAQYIPSGSISSVYLGIYGDSNLVMFPTNRGTVALTSYTRQVVHFYPFDEIPKLNDLETHQIYLSTQSSGTVEITSRVDQFSDIYYRTKYSFLLLGISSINLELDNPEGIPYSCTDFNLKRYDSSATQSTVQTQFSALCTIDTSNDGNEYTRIVPEQKITIKYQVRKNTRMPLLYGYLPTDPGIYSWGHPPSPTPYVEETNGLGALEITAIVVGCFIGITLIIILGMSCYYTVQIRKIEGKL